MRGFVSILIVLAIPQVLLAQVVEDTLDWRVYYPLEIGNEWQYTVTHWPVPLQNHERIRVVGDTTAHGKRAFLVNHDWTALEDFPVRDQSYMLWYDSTGTVTGSRFEGAPGGIDLRTNFGDSVRTEGSPLGDYLVVGGGYNAEVTIGEEGHIVPAVKYAGTTYAWGIGPITHVVFDGPSLTLSYASIDGREYGTPVITTSTHPPLPGRRSHSVSAPYPNPNNGRFSFDLDLNEVAAFELLVTDALGRVVWQNSEPARPVGSNRISLDLARLAGGIFFVHILVSDDVRSVVPVTIIH